MTSIQQLYRWKDQVEAGGDRHEKLYQVSKYTLDKFQEAIAFKIAVHDIDLKRWALQKNELKMPWFKASRWWIQQFKSKHNIVSRKITKFVTHSAVDNMKDLQQQSENFKNDVSGLISQYGAQNVFNSDQSGFNLEMHSGRILCYEGAKKSKMCCSISFLYNT